jgi:putative CRISPR-associated protein (TIGR02619 family)
MNHHIQSKPNLILSTCGTSLLTHDTTIKTRTLLNNLANHQKDEICQSDQEDLVRLRQEKQNSLFAASLPDIRRQSAELNGLIGFYEGQLNKGKQDLHFLVHSDTWLGRIVAELIKEWMDKHELDVNLLSIPELCTKDIQSFHRGLGELISWCGDTLPGYQESHHIIFNLVGGFKSIQGFMQTIGMIYADEILYIFETSHELLRIPRLPIDINHAAEQHIRDQIHLFRMLNLPRATLPYSQCNKIKDLFLYRIEEDTELSPWGRLLWDKCKRSLYAEKLLDPPSEKIRYAPLFRKNSENLEKKQIVQLNERIDDFSNFIISGKNPNRLDFKKLSGNPKPPSTHEFDAWADQSAWRVFLHRDGEVWLLDTLGPGLH